METLGLQWSAAKVRDGTLTVRLDGDRPKGWKAAFEQTVRLLGAGTWGEVSIKGAKIKVAAVPEGSEEELRFFLDGAVQQANATLVDTGDDAGDAPDEPDDEDSQGDDADTRMTSRFRDFGAET